ncbi:MAG: methylmalonyl Co-A mutase-associated GTPase MeaB [Methanomassiliicoccales archaeon]
MNYTRLVNSLVRGDRKAAAKLISIVEDEEKGYTDAMKLVYARTHGAEVIGFTGSAGVGKSTLVAQIAAAIRRQGKKLGIIAVDPTSPISGGAILGDRIRMPEIAADENIFMRSMGSRGGSGGLSTHALSAVRILDAMGCDTILVETVGAGQTQVDIMNAADTVVVVTMPGAGDEVQSIKAGLLEIADIYVVNKMDMQGAELMAEQLASMLELVEQWEGWKPPVLLTSANTGKGIPMLIEKLEEHRKYMTGTVATERRMRQAKREIYTLLFNEIERRLSERIEQRHLDEMLSKIVEKKMSPYEAAEQLASALK